MRMLISLADPRALGAGTDREAARIKNKKLRTSGHFISVQLGQLRFKSSDRAVLISSAFELNERTHNLLNDIPPGEKNGGVTRFARNFSTAADVFVDEEMES